MQRYCELRSQFHVVVFWAALLLYSAPAASQVGLGLVPMRIDLPLTPGSAHSDSLQLSNESGTRAHVRGEVVDFFIDDDENPQFGKYPSIDTSCSAFVRVTPRDAELTGNQTVLARYTIDPPATLKNGTYHCAISFTTQAPPGSPTAGLSINVQVVTALYLTVGKATYHSEVRELSLDIDPAKATKTFRAFCFLRNQGEYIWRPAGELDVLMANGSVRDHVPVKSLPVLPNHDQRFLFPLGKHPEEGDTLRLRIDVGNGEIEEADVLVSKQMLLR